MDLICEERLSDSSYIERVWRSESVESGSFISMADSHWGMAITRIGRRTLVTIRGPETRATEAESPAEAEFVGVQFRHGTLMPDLPARMLMDRCDVTLPEAGKHSFWLKGATWEIPTFDNVETFIERLVHDELLRYDPLVAASLQGKPVSASMRTVQRRFLSATGMTYNTIAQIERARRATLLLKQGMSILDTVEEAGYFDQPHLTRSLRRFIGQTPAQIISETRTERLSFLYKTSSPG